MTARPSSAPTVTVTSVEPPWPRHAAFVLDPNGTVTGCDEGAARMYRCPPEQLLGHDFVTLWPAAGATEVLPLVELGRTAGDGRHSHTGWSRRRDGVRFWAEAVTTRLRGAGGSAVGFAVVVRDLAPHTLTAEVRAILDALPDGVLGIDGADRIVFLNRSATEIFGYDPAELLGAPVGLLLPRSSQPSTVGVCRDGRRFAAEVSRSPAVGGSGPVTTVVVRDLSAAGPGAGPAAGGTDLGAQTFRLAFDLAPVGMALIDVGQGDQPVIQVNPALCRMLGLDESGLLARDPRSLLSPGDAADAAARVTALLEGAVASIDGVRCRYERPDGAEVWLRYSVWLVRRPDGTPGCLVLHTLDDTAGQRAALDQGRRNARDQHIATVLQHSLLPAVPRTIGPVAVAARYEAAGVGAAVGGDWHDAFPLPGGLVGLSVGDVAGHGVESAATMAWLRQTLRVLASGGERPRDVVARLNRVMSADRIGADIELATVLYAELDPATGSMVCCSAGHLPLLVVPGVAPPGVRPASARLATPEVNVPLGVLPEYPFVESRFELGSGELVVGYTDGVVERRGVLLHQALESLVRFGDRLAAAGVTDPEAVADALTRRLPEPPARDDDAAVLVLALPPR